MAITDKEMVITGIGKHWALNFGEIGRTSITPSWKHWLNSWETTVVYTHEYPIILPMVGVGQMLRINVCSSPIIGTEQKTVSTTFLLH